MHESLHGLDESDLIEVAQSDKGADSEVGVTRESRVAGVREEHHWQTLGALSGFETRQQRGWVGRPGSGGDDDEVDPDLPK